LQITGFFSVTAYFYALVQLRVLIQNRTNAGFSISISRYPELVGGSIAYGYGIAAERTIPDIMFLSAGKK